MRHASRPSSARPVTPGGYWLRLGRCRVFLEPSPFIDALLARREALGVRERALMFRALPGAWP